MAGGDPRATLALQADAIVAEPGTGHAAAVRVADCVPVLVADPASGRVLAVHAGWRGVTAGVVGVGVRHLVAAANAGPCSRFIAAVGPSIGPCCFEVGPEVGDRIAAAANADVVCRRIHRGKDDEKVYVDLRVAVRAQLRGLGLADDAIEDVPEGGEGCTRCHASRYYSYRRDGDASGRLVGVIVAR